MTMYLIPLMTIVFVSLVDPAVSNIHCVTCNPCNSPDPRTLGTCIGKTCITLNSAYAVNDYRGCLDYVRTQGCDIERLGRIATRTCYCSTNLCNKDTVNDELWLEASSPPRIGVTAASLAFVLFVAYVFRLVV